MTRDMNPNPDSRPVPSGGAPDSGESAPPSLVDSPVFTSLGKAAYDDPDSDTTLYRVPFLNASFAITSLVLLVLTIWAIWQDYDREWKGYQHEWFAYQEDFYTSQIENERARIDEDVEKARAEFEDLKARIENDGSIEELEYHVRQVENTAIQADKAVKAHKALMDWEKYLLEHQKQKVFDKYGGDNPAAIEEVRQLDEQYRLDWVVTYEEKQADYEAKKLIADAERAKVADRRDRLRQAEREYNSLLSQLDLLKTNLGNVEPNAKNTIRNLPLLDFFGPSAKIHKTVTEITEPLNFADVPRIDRCKSCHVNIDDVDPRLDDLTMEDTKHEGKVFRSHPNLELFMSSASPHPYLEFGCTTCHYGDGHSLTFTTTSHTPRDKEQKEEWEKEYHWHKMHHNEFPMLPSQYITATCSKCHFEESRIPGADKWNQGRKLVEDYGCFGCHKMQGLEDYRKVGPNLQHIASKVSSDFLYKWIRSPQEFRPQTRMPRFFDLANSTGSIEVIGYEGEKRTHDFSVRNGVEALAIATYLEEHSTPRADPYNLPSGQTADPADTEQVARGKAVFAEIGCLGCHSIEREGEKFMQNDHGPDLSTIGSKLDADYLVDWIVDPTKYDPKTRMPRMRIEEGPDGPKMLADLVAYLLSLRNESFDQKPALQITDENRALLRDLAYGYHAQTATRPEAKKVTDAYFADGGGGDRAALEFVGGKLISRYGCFGCHEGIAGFEDAQPIGADLSSHGSKDPARLDFGHWGHQQDGSYAIPKNRLAWFTAKLENTRVFDMLPSKKVTEDGKVVYSPSQQRVLKSPEDLLKMPLFPFHDDPDAVEAVVTFVASQLPDKLPLSKVKKLEGVEQVIEDGRRLVRFLNCEGCHRIGTDTELVNLAQLPRYSFDDPEEKQAFNTAEEETWLAKGLVLEEFVSEDGKIKIPQITFPKHTYLSHKFPFLIPERDEEMAEYSLTEILDYYYRVTGKAPHNQLVYVQGLGEGKIRNSIDPTTDKRYLSPPVLRRQGERVNGEWLFHFLRDVHPIRSNLNVRMPSYDLTPEESRTIVEMFRALSDIEGPHEVFETDDYDPASAMTGKNLFLSVQEADKDVTPAPLRLGCDSCHPMAGRNPSNPDKFSWGPNLDIAAERLRPIWMKSWMAMPTQYMPNSKMPAFWLARDNYVPPPHLAKGFGVEGDPDIGMKPEEREKLLHLLPWLSNTTVTVNEGFENWEQNLSDLLQYMVHWQQVENQ